MRCARCGVELTNKIIKINDVPYCENCARIMGYGKFLRSPEEMLGSAFSPFDEIASTIMQMNELDFGNSALSCPKCGMTLRDFEKRGRLGCIECYNTFNDYIVKEMFKQQGESTYGGRLPGQSAEMKNINTDALPEAKKEETSEAKAEPEAKESSEVKEPANSAESGSVSSADKLEKLAKADLGMLSDEELKNGIKLAAENEDYVLASKLRDELKGRNGGN
jgi:protein-arginine kinase activator protein McsA